MSDAIYFNGTIHTVKVSRSGGKRYGTPMGLSIPPRYIELGTLDRGKRLYLVYLLKPIKFNNSTIEIYTKREKCAIMHKFNHSESFDNSACALWYVL